MIRNCSASLPPRTNGSATCAGRRTAANLGDLAGAMESYLKALQIREALVAASPRDVQSRRDLARSYVRDRQPLIETSEAARGTEYLRQGLAVYLELAAEPAGGRTDPLRPCSRVQ